MEFELIENHGPAQRIPQCFFCGNDKEDPEPSKDAYTIGNKHGRPPMRGVFDSKPCKKCHEYMQEGIILVGVEKENPAVRTGHLFVVKEGSLPAWEDPEKLKMAKKLRCATICRELAEKIQANNDKLKEGKE